MGDIGVPELLIILIIVVICFGPSRLAGLGKSLGEGIRAFREGVRDGEPTDTTTGPLPSAAPPDPVPVAAIAPTSADARSPRAEQAD